MNHSRTATVIALAAAGLLLTACGSSDNPNSPAAKSKDAAEVLYAYQLGQADPDDFDGVEPSVLAAEGHRICSMLADGQGIDDAIARERLGFSDKETSAMIGAAPVLCPDQKTKVDAWAAAHK
jgi:alkyl sulfatase BDS1-like metallo-beta-lactamase superfamily hydrolase